MVTSSDKAVTNWCYDFYTTKLFQKHHLPRMSHSSRASPNLNTPTGVLQAVAVITCQRDRDLMALSLVNTLIELRPCTHIAMYRIFQNENEQEATLVAEARDNLNQSLPQSENSVLISENKHFSSVLASNTMLEQPLEDGSFLSIYPITVQHGVVGLLEITSDAHSKSDQHLIMAILKVYSNYLTLLEESETDTLTGLLNRRTFDNNIEKIIEEHSAPDDIPSGLNQHNPSRRAKSSEFPHWLAVIDIDHFKRVNDRFGHLYGDEVLLLLSRQMRLVFRQSDKLFRFGGEEFIVVLDRTSRENASNVLERFRTTIEQFHFPQVGKVTVSIGFVRLDKKEVSSSIIGRADQALYYAKHHGRNQVCFYEDLVAAGKLSGEHFSDDVQLF